MKPKQTFASLAAVCAALCLLPVAATPTTWEAVSADTVLRQMSEKLSAAKKFSFKARREIVPDLAGGDGLHGKAEIAVAVQRPDKMAATATIPNDTRRFYFDGKQLTLVDEKKNVYSTVPMVVTLDTLPSELAKIYGFTPPLAEFLISDLYQDLTWRAQSVEYRGMSVIKTGFLGLKRVHCHRLGLTGRRADSELWIAVNDSLPRRWISKVKGSTGDVEIRIELSNWNLEAKVRDEDFVFSPPKGALPIPMVTEAEMAAARKATK
jgi:hypothetical protein